MIAVFLSHNCECQMDDAAPKIKDRYLCMMGKAIFTKKAHVEATSFFPYTVLVSKIGGEAYVWRASFLREI